MEVDTRAFHERVHDEQGRVPEVHNPPVVNGYAYKGYHETIPNSDGGHHKEIAQGPRRILGLSVGIFWAIIALIVVVLAGAIGAGVGVGISHKKDTNSAPVSTTYEPLTIMRRQC